jgi:hypothetical protein
MINKLIEKKVEALGSFWIREKGNLVSKLKWRESQIASYNHFVT